MFAREVLNGLGVFETFHGPLLFRGFAVTHVERLRVLELGLEVSALLGEYLFEVTSGLTVLSLDGLVVTGTAFGQRVDLHLEVLAFLAP